MHGHGLPTVTAHQHTGMPDVTAGRSFPQPSTVDGSLPQLAPAEAPARAPGPAGEGPSPQAAAALRERIRSRGVNPVVYWVTRAVLQPFFQVYFRLARIGPAHIPPPPPSIPPPHP